MKMKISIKMKIAPELCVLQSQCVENESGDLFGAQRHRDCPCTGARGSYTFGKWVRPQGETMQTRLWALALALATVSRAWAADPTRAELEAGFRNPPDSAKPITFWHWMNGCVSKEGITADLESYKKVGLRGTQQFLVGVGRRRCWMILSVKVLSMTSGGTCSSLP